MTISKVFKIIIMFWLLSLAGEIAAALVYGIVGGLIGIWISHSFLSVCFTILFIAMYISKHKEKARAKAAAAKAKAAPKQAAETIKKEPASSDEIAAKLDACRRSIERSSRKIKDRPTAARVRNIADTLNKIARDIEHDPRDRNKVRSLADNCGEMIESLVERYIRLESQNQSSENIASTMDDICAGLETVDQSLQMLLDDLFTNDANEVNSEIAVLEKLLKANSPENRISMKDVKTSVRDTEEAPKSEATLQQ